MKTNDLQRIKSANEKIIQSLNDWNEIDDKMWKFFERRTGATPEVVADIREQVEKESIAFYLANRPKWRQDEDETGA